MNRTNNLKLKLPSSGEQGWGTAYNDNFVALDQKYWSINSQMENLRDQMGALGLYYIDETYKVELNVYVTQEWDNILSGYYYKVVDIKTDYKTDTTAQEQLSFMTEKSDSVFGQLFPYSVFMIKKIKDEDNKTELDLRPEETIRYYYKTSSTSAYTYEEWKLNDYIVKYNNYTEVEGNYPYWKRMPQTVGGYYMPANQYTKDSKGNIVLSYTRIPALETDANITIDRPMLWVQPNPIMENRMSFDLVQGKKAENSSVLIKDIAVWNYPTLEETDLSVYEVSKDKNFFSFEFFEHFIVSDIVFYTESNKQSSKKPIYIDYELVERKVAGGYKVQITVDNTYLVDEHIYMQVKFSKKPPIEELYGIENSIYKLNIDSITDYLSTHELSAPVVLNLTFNEDGDSKTYKTLKLISDGVNQAMYFDDELVLGLVEDNSGSDWVNFLKNPCFIVLPQQKVNERTLTFINKHCERYADLDGAEYVWNFFFENSPLEFNNAEKFNFRFTSAGKNYDSITVNKDTDNTCQIYYDSTKVVTAYYAEDEGYRYEDSDWHISEDEAYITIEPQRVQYSIVDLINDNFTYVEQNSKKDKK